MTNSTTKERNFDEKKAAINKLRELMRVDDKLKNLKTDDAYLERFLYAKDFCVEEAYNTMKTFYELLEEYPEWFSLGTPTDQKKIIDKNIRILTKEHDKEGRLIYIVKIANMSATQMTLLDIVAVDDMLLEAALLAGPTVCRSGLCVIVDVADLPWALTRWLTPFNVRTALRRVASVPVRDFRFHVVNSCALVHLAVGMVWPLLPSNIKQKVKFHFNNRDSLYQYVDRDVLPPEYGGKNNIDYAKCQSFLYDSQAQLVESFKNSRISFLDKVLVPEKSINKRINN